MSHTGQYKKILDQQVNSMKYVIGTNNFHICTLNSPPEIWAGVEMIRSTQDMILTCCMKDMLS